MKLAANVEEHAWDGEWYRRAYFDDGTPLGSHTNEECQIDSISQSWGVLSGAANPERVAGGHGGRSMRAWCAATPALIQLLDPPFDKADLNPGYIRGYVPGVRENGGQYTHAAIWTAMAFARMGDGERAWELLRMINPVQPWRTTRRRWRATRWSRTWWRPTCMPWRRTSGAAAGAGTRARRAGCTG